MERNRDIVKHFLDAAERGDEATMRQLLHPDVEIHEAESLPWAGVHRGIEGFQRLVRTVYRSFLDTQVSIHALLAENERVLVIATLSGRSRRDQQQFSMPIIELWELHAARIRRITPYYFDTAAIAALIPDDGCNADR